MYKSNRLHNNEIASQQNYYPFGMPMPGRSLSLSNYRFGFNTQEKVDETSGNGNHNTALFWEYDTRLGRRWNLDPKPNPSYGDYVCFLDNPIRFSDLLGDVVKLDGFSEKRIARLLGKGITSDKKTNPFYFDKNHELQFDNDKAANLSNEQKDILKNIQAVIENPTVVTLKKSHDSDLIPGYKAPGLDSKGNLDWKNLVPTAVWHASGAATAANLDANNQIDFTGGSGVTVYWNGSGASVPDAKGVKLKVPSYLILFHEIGGHGFYKYVMKTDPNPQNDTYSGGLTIDYENKLRMLNHLAPRSYDETHQNYMTV